MVPRESDRSNASDSPQPSTGAGALELVGVTKRFGGILAADAVDLALGPGQLRCLIGPNGAGKSTLLRLISGQHRPDSGRIVVDGQDVTRLHPFRRARLGLATKWQNLGTFTELTVRQNIGLAGRARRRSSKGKHHSESMAELLGLAARLDDRAGDLSHGEQQMLEIVMALAARPSIILLDEPAAGLSHAETSRMASIVRDIALGGVTVLVTEHDMAFVRELQAPVTVLHQGRVFAEGSLAEIESHAEVRRIYLGSAA